MIIQIYDDDLLNGEGIREVVFLQGCPHHCKGCFNPETWEIKTDTFNDVKYIQHLENKLSKDYISGLTISGGDPLVSFNLEITEKLIDLAKKYNKTVWVYTGYKWEHIKTIPFINKIDVICDGKFIEELKSPEKPWVGSSNQNVINVSESLKHNCIIIYE